MSDLKTKEAVKVLEKLGYTVRLSKPSLKKTFEVEAEVLERFIEVQKASKMKVREAINEAITDWVRKKGY